MIADVEADAAQAMAQAWTQARAASAAGKQGRDDHARQSAKSKGIGTQLALEASLQAERRAMDAVGTRTAAGPPHAAHYAVFVPECSAPRVHGEDDIRAVHEQTAPWNVTLQRAQVEYEY